MDPSAAGSASPVRRAAHPAAVLEALERMMGDRGTNAIQPRASIGSSRRGEGRARKLLRVQAERTALRGIAASRQRPRQRLAGEFVAEAAHVSIGFGRVCAHKRHSMTLRAEVSRQRRRCPLRRRAAVCRAHAARRPARRPTPSSRWPCGGPHGEGSRNPAVAGRPRRWRRPP